MSGSSGEKTELPTPKKQRDARQKGQVPRSQEVVSAVSLFAVIGYVYLAWTPITDRLFRMFEGAAKLATGDFRVNAYNGISFFFWEAIAILAPILGVTILAAIAANVFQFGIVFAMESLVPKPDKISPAAGFKRIFSMKQIVETLKSILKIVFLSILMYVVLKAAIQPFATSLSCGLPCQLNLTAAVLLKTLAYSGLAFLIVAVADLAYQRKTHTKSLMMSKEEIKREYKESEGDPHVKGHRRQLAQEMVMGDGGHAAKKGTAVVVNPTHFAVVLHYRQGETPLPVVTAKGRNIQAHYLRTQAEEAGVPIFRNVQLARALYATTEIQDVIPDELFDAVAEVLAWVARNEAKLFKGRLDHGVIDMEAGDHRPRHTADA